MEGRGRRGERRREEGRRKKEGRLTKGNLRRRGKEYSGERRQEREQEDARGGKRREDEARVGKRRHEEGRRFESLRIPRPRKPARVRPPSSRFIPSPTVLGFVNPSST